MSKKTRGAEEPTFVGFRDDDDCRVMVVKGCDSQELDPCYNLCNHSPTGFEWGYEGSGPAQLAFAMLYYASKGDEELTRRHYQKFKAHCVARWGQDATIEFPVSHVQSWITVAELLHGVK